MIKETSLIRKVIMENISLVLLSLVMLRSPQGRRQDVEVAQECHREGIGEEVQPLQHVLAMKSTD